MRFRNVLTGLTGGLLAACLAVPAVALDGTVTADGSVLRVRKSASTSAAILDLLPDGSRVDIVDTSSAGWYGIKVGELTGYVSTEYITLSESGAAPAEVAAAKAVEAAPAAEAAYVRITADSLNVRSGPGTEYERVGSLASGRVVRVLSQSNGWYETRSGYITAEYTEAASAADAVESGLYVRTTADSLNVRSGPGTEYEKVGSLASGRCVKVLEILNGWYKIEQGYVSADFVEETDGPAAVSERGQAVADFALQFVGYNYVYGGSSPRSGGFDCSGLTYYTCAQFGSSINRTASAQLQNGFSVSKDELAPGDLVFFKKPGNKSGKPASHVGIYIGDGKFVHASDYGVGVIISRLTDSYYTVGYVGARRVVV